VNGTFAFAWVVIYGVVVVSNMSMHQHDSSARIKEREEVGVPDPGRTKQASNKAAEAGTRAAEKAKMLYE
jgi:hypothetical protein